MVLDPKPSASPLTHFPHSFPIDLASFPTWINSYVLPPAPSSMVHGLQLSPHRLSWQQTHPKTASGFFLDTSMVRLDPLRPGGQPCRSSSTVAASSGCRRVAVAAPLSMAPLLGSPLLKTMPRWSIQSWWLMLDLGLMEMRPKDLLMNGHRVWAWDGAQAPMYIAEGPHVLFTHLKLAHLIVFNLHNLPP